MAKETHNGPAKAFHVPADIAALGRSGVTNMILDSMRKAHAFRMANVTKRKPIQRKKKKG